MLPGQFPGTGVLRSRPNPLRKKCREDWGAPCGSILSRGQLNSTDERFRRDFSSGVLFCKVIRLLPHLVAHGPPNELVASKYLPKQIWRGVAEPRPADRHANDGEIGANAADTGDSMAGSDLAPVASKPTGQAASAPASVVRLPPHARRSESDKRRLLAANVNISQLRCSRGANRYSSIRASSSAIICKTKSHRSRPRQETATARKAVQTRQRESAAGGAAGATVRTEGRNGGTAAHQNAERAGLACATHGRRFADCACPESTFGHRGICLFSR